jgi:hypothetical protein
MLEVIFPVLFGRACVNDASIADNLEILSGSNHLNVSFARAAKIERWMPLLLFIRFGIK